MKLLLIKKITSVICLTAAVFSLSLSPAICSYATAADTETSDSKQTSTDWPKGPSVGSKSAVLMDVDSGTVLYSKKPNSKHFPASITKIMTCLLAVENSSLDETVTFSKEAVAQSAGGSSSISRDVGEKMTMEECLYGMMLESANECAWAIAEHVGGTEEKFVDMMNAKAKSLGCTHTHFTNPNGLPDDDHWTSALDMARISRVAYHNSVFAKIVGTKTYQIPPTNKHKDITYLNNHHCMLNFYHTSQYLYDYCVGGKTGYTIAARSTLVTYAKKDGKTLVCVVMCAERPDHWTDTRKLFDWGFDHFKSVKVSDMENLSGQTDKIGSVNYGNSDQMVTADSDSTIMIPVDASENSVSMSIKKSSSDDEDVIGLMVFRLGRKKVGTCQLLVKSSELTTYPFHNLSTKEGGSDVTYVQVNILYIIVLAVVIIAACIGLFFLIRHIYWNVSRHHRDSVSDRKGHITYTKIRNNHRK